MEACLDDSAPRYGVGHMTVPELAKHWKLAEVTIRKWIGDGRLQVSRLGKSIRISHAVVEDMEMNGLRPANRKPN